MKDEEQSDFEEIFDAIERMGVASLSQIESVTKFTRQSLKTRLGWYVKKGKLFRIAKDRYATEAHTKVSSYIEKRNRLEEQREASAFAVDFFNKMVKIE